MINLHQQPNTATLRNVTRGRSRGWIGVEIGTDGIKLAQLNRSADGFTFAAKWTLPDGQVVEAKDEDVRIDSLQSQLKKIKGLRQLFAGRRCAAVLPMAFVEHRSFEIPRGTTLEQKRMAGEEMAAELGVESNELALDCWEGAKDPFLDSSMVRLSAHAVSKRLAHCVGDQLLRVGLECQVLDGLPCVLARAVELAHLGNDDEAVVAVDLSATLPLVVLVKNGRPLFARTLRGVGLSTIMQPLQDALTLSTEECQQLLTRYGIAAFDQPPSAVVHRTTQLIAHPLQDLGNEIKRTIDYLRQQFRSDRIGSVCLFGSGAIVKNLPNHLSHKLHLPVAPWALNEGDADAMDATYGVAAGLSALAWDADACL